MSFVVGQCSEGPTFRLAKRGMDRENYDRTLNFCELLRRGGYGDA